MFVGGENTGACPAGTLFGQDRHGGDGHEGLEAEWHGQDSTQPGRGQLAVGDHP